MLGALKKRERSFQGRHGSVRFLRRCTGLVIASSVVHGSPRDIIHGDRAGGCACSFVQVHHLPSSTRVGWRCSAERLFHGSEGMTHGW
jgi:hypothetical protein